MLIGLVGPAFSGKSTIVKYLNGLSFVHLSIVQGEPQSRHQFNSAGDVLGFVMVQWRSNFVLTGIELASDWDVFLKRPFFLMIAVECPVGIRYDRHGSSIALSEFLKQDDQSMYFGTLSKSHEDVAGGMVGLSMNRSASLFSIMNHAHLKILNICESVTKLYDYLDYINLLDHERLRPCWDTYFMKLCDLAASRSNCKYFI